jgi:hypothetical protein
MTAPLDKTKEVTGDYKRFHDATDSGPSMNTATVREMLKDIYAGSTTWRIRQYLLTSDELVWQRCRA